MKLGWKLTFKHAFLEPDVLAFGRPDPDTGKGGWRLGEAAQAWALLCWMGPNPQTHGLPWLGKQRGWSGNCSERLRGTGEGPGWGGDWEGVSGVHHLNGTVWLMARDPIRVCRVQHWGYLWTRGHRETLGWAPERGWMRNCYRPGVTEQLDPRPCPRP